MSNSPSTMAAAKLATAAMYAALSLYAPHGHGVERLPLESVERRLGDGAKVQGNVAAGNGMTSERLIGVARGEMTKKGREDLATQESEAPAITRDSSRSGRDIPLAVVRQNLIDDPDLLAKVAAKNGMTAARFMGQEEGRILQMVRGYLAERSGRTRQPLRTQ